MKKWLVKVKIFFKLFSSSYHFIFRVRKKRTLKVNQKISENICDVDTGSNTIIKVVLFFPFYTQYIKAK